MELTKADIPNLWERFLKDYIGVDWPYTMSGTSVLVRTAQYTKNGQKAPSPQEPMMCLSKFTQLFSLTARTVFTEGGFPSLIIEGTPKATPENLKYLSNEGVVVKIADSASFSVRIDDAVYTTTDYCADKKIEGTEVRKEDLFKMAAWVQQKALYNSDFFRQENIFRFDHEPKMMFVYNITRIHSPKSDADDVWLHCDYPLTFTLSGAGREITEPDTDLELYTANDRIPMRDALMTFDDEDGVTRSISVNVNRRKSVKGVEKLSDIQEHHRQRHCREYRLGDQQGDNGRQHRLADRPAASGLYEVRRRIRRATVSKHRFVGCDVLTQDSSERNLARWFRPITHSFQRRGVARSDNLRFQQRRDTSQVE